MNRHAIAKRILRSVDKADRALHCKGYKTGCTSEILGFYGIERKSFRFCQYASDMIRIFNRNGFSCKRMNRAKVKNKIENLGLLKNGFYLVQVSGHVALAYVTSGKVNFPIDTSPQSTASRELLSIHKIGRIAKK